MSGARQALSSCFTLTVIALVLNGSVLVLGACCQRGSGTISKFQMPGPWLKASAVGEGKLVALEDWTGEDLRARSPLYHKECAMARKSLKCGAM